MENQGTGTALAVDRRRRRSSPAARRWGYAVAIVVNVVMWFVINKWPGWSAWPPLTDATEQVLWWVNASLWVGVAANVVLLAYDPRWLKALTDLLTTAVGLVVLRRIWQVFPFDFRAGTYDWALIVRIVLVVAIVGSIIGLVVQLVTLAAATVRQSHIVRPSR